MQKMLLFLLLLVVTPCAPSQTKYTVEEAKTNGMLETLQNYIEHSDTIADICIYEQEWINAPDKHSKGTLIHRAVVTGVHKGKVKVGTKLEFSSLVEDPPTIFPNFKTSVEGQLVTFFYDSADGREIGGRVVIEGDGHWGIDRIGDIFSELFELEKQSNPFLQQKK